MRLRTDDDDDNNDDRVVVAVVKNDDDTLTNKAEIKREQAANDGTDAKTTYLTPEEKPEAIDLTVDELPGDTRRNFSHTAEVIKARYTRKCLVMSVF